MNTIAAPRRPWLAALLSLVLPGFGQFYVGDANRALGFFLAFAILGIPIVIIASLYLPIELTAVSVALATLASVGVWVYAVVDVWRMARRTVPARRLANAHCIYKRVPVDSLRVAALGDRLCASASGAAVSHTWWQHESDT